MEFREAAEIARRNPGARVTRDPDGGFTVVHEDGSLLSGTPPAMKDVDHSHRESEFLQRENADIQRMLMEERRDRGSEVSGLRAEIVRLQKALRASEQALLDAGTENERLKERISRVTDEDWENIKTREHAERESRARELRAERHEQKCSCLGEVEDCARCDGKGTYTVDGFGNRV